MDAPLVIYLSLKGEGGEILEKGFVPLLPALPLPLLREGGQGDRLLNKLCLGEEISIMEFEKLSKLIFAEMKPKTRKQSRTINLC